MKDKKSGIRIGGILLLLVCVIAFAAGCRAAQQEEDSQKEGYKKLSAKQAKERMDAGGSLVVIDARTQKEYDYMHVSGAMLIPDTDISGEPLADIPELDREILIYSRSVKESRQAAERLVDAGYTNVAEFGSMEDWPYAVEMSKDSSAGFT